MNATMKLFNPYTLVLIMLVLMALTLVTVQPIHISNQVFQAAFDPKSGTAEGQLTDEYKVVLTWTNTTKGCTVRQDLWHKGGLDGIWRFDKLLSEVFPLSGGRTAPCTVELLAAYVQNLKSSDNEWNRAFEQIINFIKALANGG